MNIKITIQLTSISNLEAFLIDLWRSLFLSFIGRSLVTPPLTPIPSLRAYLIKSYTHLSLSPTLYQFLLTTHSEDTSKNHLLTTHTPFQPLSYREKWHILIQSVTTPQPCLISRSIVRKCLSTSTLSSLTQNILISQSNQLSTESTLLRNINFLNSTNKRQSIYLRLNLRE